MAENKRNPALERLGVLIGEWNLEIISTSFNTDPSAVERGRTSFDWLEGGAFLTQHSEVWTSAVTLKQLIWSSYG